MDNLWDFLMTTWPGQLISALLCWALTALYYWNIGRHGRAPLHGWLDLMIYGALGKWSLVYIWGFFGAVVHIRRHLESCSQDLLRQARR